MAHVLFRPAKWLLNRLCMYFSASSLSAILYPLEQDELPVIYGFQDQVPVGIFGGELCVDFAQIDEYLEEL